MSMREFRREFGNMEELAPILGDVKGRDTNPENSPMEDAGVSGDAPLGEHGTVVSGMETWVWVMLLEVRLARLRMEQALAGL